MSLLDSGALWDTYSNKPPPILRGNCRMSQFRPDTRPPHSWSHLAIHRLGTCSTWSQKPMAGKGSHPWFLVLCRRAAKRGCFPLRALAGGKCVKVSRCWQAAKHASGPWCLRQIHVLVLLVRKELGMLVEHGLGAGGSAYRYADSRRTGWCIVHVQCVCWLNSHSPATQKQLIIGLCDGSVSRGPCCPG